MKPIEEAFKLLDSLPHSQGKAWLLHKVERHRPKPREPRGQKTLQALRRQLVPLFSRWVRMNAADEHGYCACVTCGERHPWQEMDCGHFMPSALLPTKFHLKNVGPQCRDCNSQPLGRRADFGRHLDDKFGPETAERVRWLSKNGRALSKTEIENLITLCRRETGA